MLFMITMSGSG